MSPPEVITLGCRLNLAESERIAALLGGVDDLVVVNSCAVTAEAVRQSRTALRRVRVRRPAARIVVTGCASEIEPSRFEGLADAIVPNAAKLRPDAWSMPGTYAPRQPPAGHTRAFVPVQTGCDHDCTFCIIPQGRGPSLSRRTGTILREIEALVSGGVREVVLTGVDLTAWQGPEGERLGNLVAAILEGCPSLPRVRLSSLDGIEIDPLLFEIIVGEPRVMPHVHLSLQAGDDLVLKRMKRRHSQAQARELVSRLQAARPDIAIGADLIAGFPTEDEAMHANSLAAIDDCRIVHGHVFPFSPRPGTPAARMPQVDPMRVRERAAELRARIAGQRRGWLGGLVGTCHPVLAEKDGTGHAPNFARFRLPAAAAPGTLIDLRATGVDDGLLVGMAA